MKEGIALVAIELTTPGALAVSEAAEMSTGRYGSTTADSHPGLRTVGPTSCGFAKRAGDAWERKHVPSREIRPDMWMLRPAARVLARGTPELPRTLWFLDEFPRNGAGGACWFMRSAPMERLA